jgi:hypothetical protein
MRLLLQPISFDDNVKRSALLDEKLVDFVGLGAMSNQTVTNDWEHGTA